VGAKLGENRILRDEAGKPKLNIDIAHPIDSQCRQRFEHAIIDAFNKELHDSKQPGYKPKMDEAVGDVFTTSQHEGPD
jgi:stage V sporulation protein G